MRACVVVRCYLVSWGDFFKNSFNQYKYIRYYSRSNDRSHTGHYCCWGIKGGTSNNLQIQANSLLFAKHRVKIHMLSLMLSLMVFFVIDMFYVTMSRMYTLHNYAKDNYQIEGLINNLVDSLMCEAAKLKS